MKSKGERTGRQCKAEGSMGLWGGEGGRAGEGWGGGGGFLYLLTYTSFFLEDIKQRPIQGRIFNLDDNVSVSQTSLLQV